MTGTEPYLSAQIAAEENRQEEAWHAGNGWPCELCISGRCGDMACDFGRHCQAAFCTPPLQEAWQAGTTATDDAHHEDVLRELRRCAACWDGDARLFGNVRARDIVRAIDTILAATEALKANLKSLAAPKSPHWYERQRQRYRRPEGECEFCDANRHSMTMPPHTASDWCESGKRDHCTCDLCY